jgi:hypothetical protein
MKGIPHIDPDCSASRAPFWQRVAETIAWCQPRIVPSSPRDCLRTAAFRGRPLEGSFRDCVLSVARARQQDLGPIRLEPARSLAGGRLLVYFPDADLCDGGAEIASQGFFDVYNTPPSGTWVAFVMEPDNANISYAQYLIAWIPPAFLELAAAGVLANPEQCIRWLDERNVSLARFLHQAV